MYRLDDHPAIVFGAFVSGSRRLPLEEPLNELPPEPARRKMPAVAAAHRLPAALAVGFAEWLRGAGRLSHAAK